MCVLYVVLSVFINVYVHVFCMLIRSNRRMLIEIYMKHTDKYIERWYICV